MSIKADLTALQSLPPDVLSKLTNPFSPAPPALPASESAARSDLASFLSNPNPARPSAPAYSSAGATSALTPPANAEAVHASHAYVAAMRAAADQLTGNVITHVDADGARLEGVREQAEVARAAVAAYAAAIGK
jgi:hypothetical protein